MPYKELVVTDQDTACINKGLLHEGLPRNVRWWFQHLSCFTEVYLGCGVKNTSSWFSWKWYKWRTMMFFSSATTVTGSTLAVSRAHIAIVRSVSCSAMITPNSGCNVVLSWWMKLDLFAGLAKNHSLWVSHLCCGCTSKCVLIFPVWRYVVD